MYFLAYLFIVIMTCLYALQSSLTVKMIFADLLAMQNILTAACRCFYIFCPFNVSLH